jgi:hypothetical protein
MERFRPGGQPSLPFRFETRIGKADGFGACAGPFQQTARQLSGFDRDSPHAKQGDTSQDDQGSPHGASMPPGDLIQGHK